MEKPQSNVIEMEAPVIDRRMLGTKTLLGHAQLHDVVLRFLKPKDFLQVRTLSSACQTRTEDYVVADVVEYLLQGRDFALPEEIAPLCRVFYALSLTTNAEFTRRVMPLLDVAFPPKRDSANSAEITRSADVWVNLGNTMDDNKFFDGLYGRSMRSLECYMVSLDMKDDVPRAWNNLSHAMRSMEIKIEEEHKKAKAKAEGSGVEVECPPMPRIMFRGREMSCVDAARRAAEVDPTYFRAWRRLGFHISGDETIEVHGEKFTDRECYAKCIELEGGTTASDWFNLGLTMRSQPPISIKGKKYTEIDCLCQDLEREPKGVASWRLLFRALPSGDTVTVKGDQVDEVACVGKIVDLEDLPENWALGRFLPAGSLVHTRWGTYNPLECLAKAIITTPHDKPVEKYSQPLQLLLPHPPLIPLDGKLYKYSKTDSRLLVELKLRQGVTPEEACGGDKGYAAYLADADRKGEAVGSNDDDSDNWMDSDTSGDA